MAFSYGFYDSLDGDRKYTASQLSAMFDGLINDGVFNNVGNRFVVTAPPDGLTVVVGTGRAWFNGTWSVNETEMRVTLDRNMVPIVYSRIATIYLEINKATSTRANAIKVAYGDIASNPVPPALTRSESQRLYQYPLAYIRLSAGTTEITNSMITVAVGGEECPLVTAVNQSTTIAQLFTQWNGEFDDWMDDNTDEYREWYQELKDICEPGTEAGTVAIMKQEWMQFEREQRRFHDSSVIEFGADGWTQSKPYIQECSIDDMTSDDTPIIQVYIPDEVTVVDAEDYLEECGYITKFVTDTNKVIAYCYSDRPTMDLAFTVKGR